MKYLRTILLPVLALCLLGSVALAQQKSVTHPRKHSVNSALDRYGLLSQGNIALTGWLSDALAEKSGAPTGGVALAVEEQSPESEQGGIMAFCSPLATMADNADAQPLPYLLSADTISEFSPEFIMCPASASEVTVKVYFERMMDDGLTWTPLVDTTGTTISYSLTNATTTGVGISMPAISVTGGLVRAVVQRTAGVAAYKVTVRAGWRP